MADRISFSQAVFAPAFEVMCNIISQWCDFEVSSSTGHVPVFRVSREIDLLEIYCSCFFELR